MKEQTRSGPGATHPRREPSIAVHVCGGRALQERQGPPAAVAARAVYLEKVDVSAAAEERRRTGRYLAVCLTLVMLFIACYHVLMRQMPVLVGLLAPAIIMILYLIWLLYYAMKRKRTEIASV